MSKKESAQFDELCDLFLDESYSSNDNFDFFVQEASYFNEARTAIDPRLKEAASKAQAKIEKSIGIKAHCLVSTHKGKPTITVTLGKIPPECKKKENRDKFIADTSKKITSALKSCGIKSSVLSSNLDVHNFSVSM